MLSGAISTRPACGWVLSLVGVVGGMIYSSAVALSQDAGVARLRLEESREAIEKLRTLQYKGSVTSTGPLFGTIASLESTVWVARVGDGAASEWNHRRIGHTVVRNPATGESEELSFDVMRKGPNVTYTDHNLRTVYERFHRAARHPTVTVAQTGWIGEFVQGTPFDRELSGGAEVQLSIEFGGDVVGDTVCDVVTVNFGEQRHEIRWSIGQDDDLPRRRELRLGQDNVQTFTITEMIVDSELAPSVFEYERPSGYAFNTTVRAPRDPSRQTTVTYPTAKGFEVTIAQGPGQGETVSLESLSGRVVVLDFWAGWSGASRDSRADVQAIAEAFADEPVTVLSMTWRERGRVQAGIDAWKESGATYPLVTGADTVAMDYAVSSFPTVFVVTKDGKLVFTMNEYNAETFRSSIEDAVRKALDGGFDPGATTTTITPQENLGNQQPGGGNQSGGNQTGGNQSGGNQSGGNQPGGNQPR